MFQHRKVLFLQILLLSAGGDAQLQFPEDQTVQAFSYAFFPCVSEDLIPVWIINGTYYHSIMLPAHHWSNTNGTGLIVEAIPEINNTGYQCQLTMAGIGSFLFPQHTAAYLFINGMGIVDSDSPRRPPTPLLVAVNSTAQSLVVKMLDSLSANSTFSTSSCNSFNEANVSFGVPCNELVVSSVAMQGTVMLHISNYLDTVTPPGVADSLVISVNVSHFTNVPILSQSGDCFESYLSGMGCYTHTPESYLISTPNAVIYCTIDNCGQILNYKTQTSPKKEYFCLSTYFAQTIPLLFDSVNLQEVTIQEYCPKSLSGNSCGNSGVIHHYGNIAILHLEEPSNSSADLDCSTVCSYNPLIPTSSHDITPTGCLSASISSTLLPTTVLMTTISTVTDSKSSVNSSFGTQSQSSSVVANSSISSIYYTLATITNQPSHFVTSSEPSIYHTSQTMPPMTTPGLSVSYMPDAITSLVATSSKPSVRYTASPSPSKQPSALNTATIIAVCVILMGAVLIFILVMTVKLLRRYCSTNRRSDQFNQELQHNLGGLNNEGPPCANANNLLEGGSKLDKSMRPTMKQFHKLEITDEFGERKTLSIITHMASEWRSLGLHLNFNDRQLNNYGENYNRVEKCCAKMLEDWIHRGKDCQWSTFLRALEDLSEHALLERLKTEFFN